MSTANTGDNTTGRYNPPSAERKLEKQLAQSRANQNSLSAIPGTWKVKKDPRLGTHFVLMMGKDDADYVHHLVIHRLIGSDYTINKKEAWVMSLASDIPQYLANAEYSGKGKCVKLLKALKNKAAVAAGHLVIEMDGTEKYPNGDSREDALDMARESSDAHAKVKGGHHFGEWILYLSPDHVEAELKIQAATRGDPEYGTEKGRILAGMAAFRTSLMNKATQQEVPYLYGVPEKDVLRTVYSALVGENPTKEETEFVSGILPYKIFSGYKVGDDSMRQNLVRLLQIHAEAQKGYNIAKSKVGSAKLKEDKAAAKADLVSAERELDDITARILAAEDEGDYPLIEADTRFEIAIDPKLSTDEVRKLIARLGQATTGAE